MIKILFFIFFSLFSYSIQTMAGTYVQGRVWTDPVVSVCFARNISQLANSCDTEEINSSLTDPVGGLPLIELTEELRQGIQQLILAEFSADRTGISFTGWEVCQSESTADVQVFIAEPVPVFPTMAQVSSIGPCKPESPKKSVAVHANLNQISDNFTKAALIHEFAHVAGLVHEERELPDVSNYIRLTPFDENSIVSNTFINRFNARGDCKNVRPHLSNGDLHSLKCLYKIGYANTHDCTGQFNQLGPGPNCE